MRLNSTMSLLISFCFVFLSASCAIQSNKPNNIFKQREYSHIELIKAMKNPDSDIRTQAIYALGEKAFRVKNEKEKMELIAKDSCKPLSSSLNDNNWEVKRATLSTLNTIVCVNATDNIILKLKDNKTEVQTSAAYTLSHYPSKKTIVALKKVIDENRSTFFAEAATRLKNFAIMSLNNIANNDKLQLNEFAEVPPIPDNFALVYLLNSSRDRSGSNFFINETKIGNLKEHEYTWVLVKEGKYNLRAEEAGLLGRLQGQQYVNLKSSNIYLFLSTISFTEKEITMPRNGKLITKTFGFSRVVSEKELISYNFRPAQISKIE